MAKKSSNSRNRFDIRMTIEFGTPLGEYLQQFSVDGNHSGRLKQLAMMGLALETIKRLNPETPSLQEAKKSNATHASDSSTSRVTPPQSNPPKSAQVKLGPHNQAETESELDTEPLPNFDPSILKIKVKTD